MARGRKPKPAEQRQKEGNKGKRPIGDPVLLGPRVSADVIESDDVPGMDDSEVAAELAAARDVVMIGEKAYAKDSLPFVPRHLMLTDELNDDTECADLWYEIAALLIDGNILAGGDILVLESLVEAILIAREAYEELRGEGTVVTTQNASSGRSSQKTNPSFKVWRDARIFVLRLAEQYALTPSARARLGLAIGQGRKLAAEIGDGLPENPRKAARPDDVDGTAHEVSVERDGA